MSQEEAIALVQELGGTPAHADRMRDILDRLLRAERQRSVMTWPLSDHAETVTVWRPAAEPGQPTEAHRLVGDRYVDLGLLGEGGMGEVRRVRDRRLGRTLAMKVASAELLARPEMLARFIAEAQATAQLQHPGIVPVHEPGWLPDGRPYFTMQEVRGRTLAAVIAQVHAGAEAHSGGGDWTFRRLVDAFLRVCEAVSYAHERGVVHRDLKPDNVMVGEHGQVLVLDWGIAKIRADAGEPDTAVITDRSLDAAQVTMMGAVAGTPAYMSPEQARGEIDRIDHRSDIYSLGAILFELLDGRPPYDGEDAWAVLEQVREGAPRDLEPDAGQRPVELITACMHAMARDPGDRFETTGALARAVRDWLDGARRRERALGVVRSVQSLTPKAIGLRAEAAALRDDAAVLLASVKPWEPEARKLPAWEKLDGAVERERRAAILEQDVERGIYAALRVDPALPEAHVALANRLRDDHRAAEASRDAEALIRAESGLREHVAALPESNEVRRDCAAYLRGDGALTLVTDPPGAEVTLHRFEVQSRRMEARFQADLGRTPLERVTLPMGSYLCELRREGYALTRYPISIGRQEHWDGVPPGATLPQAVRLLRLDALDRDDCHVPAGWFWSGGDPKAPSGLPRRRRWVGGRVMRRFPVTNREFVGFLDDLVSTGREDEAMRCAPRERGSDRSSGAMIYARDADGRFVLRPDAEGDPWEQEAPVLLVDWWSAAAYARWAADQDGRAWRLPTEHEWEKAARGVDGRFFPWGDHLDPSWCCMRDSHAGRLRPVSVDSFPADVSVYGVRGLGGNSRDWCSDVMQIRPGSPERRVNRGGSWSSTGISARSAERAWLSPGGRWVSLGFRLIRAVE